MFLEMGFRGSPNPIERVRLDSFVGEEIVQGRAGDAASLDEYKDDFYPFDFTLLHPTRTFVEKLLALHGAFFQGIEKVRTRHYYDLFCLFTCRRDIQSFLGESGFTNLVQEAIRIGNENFGTHIDPNLNLGESPALNLTDTQVRILETQYRQEARYYFRGQPAFGDIVRAIFSIRDRLIERSRAQ